LSAKGGTPKQITIRHPSPELARRLQAIAAARGQSLNATILWLLEQATGMSSRRQWLQRWATWSEADGAEFDQALRAQRVVDLEMWE
jgi:hypothetical protein